VILLINNEAFIINIKILLNQKLYKRNVIDDSTYRIVNEKLLKRLNELKCK